MAYMDREVRKVLGVEMKQVPSFNKYLSRVPMSLLGAAAFHGGESGSFRTCLVTVVISSSTCPKPTSSEHRSHLSRSVE